MLVQLQRITKNYGTEPLFEELNLQINKGEKIGLIGTNGSGKSTILKIITGIETVDSGTVSCKKNARIGYLAQMPDVCEQKVKDYLLETFTLLNSIHYQLTQLEEQMTNPECDLDKILARYGQKQEEFQQAGGYEMENKLEMIANGLMINYLLPKKLSELSGGEQTIVALARILLQENDLVLLDEPTNHLDTQRITWLEGYLTHEKTAYLIVSHDRLFLDHTVEKIVELEEGHLQEYKGNYSAYKRQKEEQLEKLRKDFAEQQKEIQKLKLAIRRFRQWGHEGDNEKFFKKAKQLEKRLEKIQRIPKPKDETEKISQKFKETNRSGKEVLQFKEVSKSYTDRILFDKVEFSLFWKEHSAIIGENGVGKSTLLKLALGLEGFDSGEIKQGTNLQVGYLPQVIRYKNPKQTLLQSFSEACSLAEQESRRALAKYSFYSDDVMKQVRFLSGGEKIRLELAKLMHNEVNFLVLDEPTNHLDIETREEIEEILEDFKGTMLVVSHDRFFLQKMFDTFLIVDQQKIKKEIGTYVEVLTYK
ncbi:ABC-F family ATP-binding cassette domain-containing protein [Enterococcus ureasiticus]|uniref:ribosomal protection-like ABC-F family protein n=1 Tax=Enterococcus ureasiticus TaxID=903984 RepID=UPI001A8F7014|nr:ABC-F family ATP-binding cassette domain-containing protein [Enterococcus ureasiticus]MBO0472289.1 ABC-F family ATP-binding cassette domain-containing protein [Enterococcus ureasiticus]